ncbi:hypothetical protein MRX96_047566 [Rhipicephalus microplus]
MNRSHPPLKPRIPPPPRKPLQSGPMAHRDGPAPSTSTQAPSATSGVATPEGKGKDRAMSLISTPTKESYAQATKKPGNELTAKSTFETVPYAGYGNVLAQAPCQYGLFYNARSQHTTANADKFCDCMKCSLALEVLRHPDEWNIGQPNIEIRGALVDMEVINNIYLVD